MNRFFEDYLDPLIKQIAEYGDGDVKPLPREWDEEGFVLYATENDRENGCIVEFLCDKDRYAMRCWKRTGSLLYVGGGIVDRCPIAWAYDFYAIPPAGWTERRLLEEQGEALATLRLRGEERKEQPGERSLAISVSGIGDLDFIQRTTGLPFSVEFCKEPDGLGRITFTEKT